MNDNTFEKDAIKVSVVGIIGNLLLSLFKFFAGFFSHSGAIISDAVHSISDIFSSIIVIIGVKFSSRKADVDHPYGHERFESVAAIILSAILFITGLFIGIEAFQNIWKGEYKNNDIPGTLAIVAALISIAGKEGMYWYTRHFARKIDSDALMADAWHHRSDAFSSVGALIGIIAARQGFPIMDPIASIIICLFIFKAAYDIFKEAINKMVDRSCDADTENEIKECILSQDGVICIDVLHTRLFGNKIYVDVEICTDGNQKLSEAHAIAERVHCAIEETFPEVKHTMVHVNPF